MKNITLKTSIFIASAFAISTAMAEDYSKIRKDVIVMNKIIETALESDDDCKKCGAAIKGTYLAEQGAVFVISPTRSFFKKILLSSDDGAHDWDIEGFDMPEIPDVPEIPALSELPEMIGTILTEVQVQLDNIDIERELQSTDGRHHIITKRLHRESDEQRQQRNEMRTLRREIRDLRDEMREQEIEMLRAEEGARKEVEANVAKMESELDAKEDKRESLLSSMNEASEARKAERMKAREAADAAQKKIGQMREDIVLSTLCDYGGSLKNLPEKENVSIMFEGPEQKWSDNSNKFFVLSKKDLLACQRGSLNKEQLEKKSISYNF